MDVKYTFRDLIVYLLTGFTSVALFLIIYPQYLDDFSVLPYLRDHDNSIFLIILVSIPSLYMIGHIIQIFDLIMSFHLARKFRKYKSDGNFSSKKFRFWRGVYFFLASATAEYQYIIRNVSQQEYTRQKYTLIVKGQYTTVDYYYLMGELFNGLRVYMFFFLIYMFFNWPGMWPFSAYLALYFLFWVKAYNSKKNHISEIIKIFSVVDAIQTLNR